MTQAYTPRALTVAGIMAVGLAVTGPSASAQTATTTTATTPDSAGVLTTAKKNNKQATTATPDMINEAIQRSQARSANERLNGTPQRFGSEEPFTYDPTK